MLLKYFTQKVIYKIRSLKCLFNSIIFKSNFIKGEKEWREEKETKRGRQEETRWRKGR